MNLTLIPPLEIASKVHSSHSPRKSTSATQLTNLIAVSYQNHLFVSVTFYFSFSDKFNVTCFPFNLAMTVREFVQSSLKNKEEFGVKGYNL